MLSALKQHRERQQARRSVAPEWVDNDLIFPTALVGRSIPPMSDEPLTASLVRRG